MKSQISLEYLIVASIILFLIATVFYYSLRYSSESVIFSQAQDAVNTIANTADNIYSLGTGSTQRVLVFIPQNVVNSTIKDNVISLKLKLGTGESDVFAFTKAKVYGNLTSISSGYHYIQINNTESGVNIK